MQSLHTLPTELRHQIIDLVINTRTEPPRDAFTDETPRRPSSPNPNLMYPALAPWEVYNAYGLILSCRQLHKDAKKRVKWFGLPAKVDVMVVNRRDLWPTWICIPSRACRTVEITFRLGDSADQFVDHMYCHFGIQHGGHVPGTVVDLLKHILDMCTNGTGTITTSDSGKQLLSIPFDPPPRLQLPLLKIDISAPDGVFNRGTAPFDARNESADLSAYDNIHLLRCRINFVATVKRVEARWPALKQQPTASLKKAVAWFILTGIDKVVTKTDDSQAGFVLQFPNGVILGRIRVFIDGEREAGVGELW